jgi:hypothetical protein
MEEVVNTLRRLIRVETFAQFRVLRRHADRTTPGMAV